MRVTIADAVAEGDRVAVRAVWRGTHRGTFQGFPATQRIVTFEGMVFWQLKDGRIAARWAVIDLAGILRQTAGLMRARLGSVLARARPFRRVRARAR